MPKTLLVNNSHSPLQVGTGTDAPRTISFTQVGSANTSRTYSGRLRGSILMAMQMHKITCRTMTTAVSWKTFWQRKRPHQFEVSKLSHALFAGVIRNDCPTIPYLVSISYQCQALLIPATGHFACAFPRPGSMRTRAVHLPPAQRCAIGDPCD